MPTARPIAETRAAIEAAMSRDSAIRERVEAHRRSRASMAGGFGDPIEGTGPGTLDGHGRARRALLARGRARRDRRPGGRPRAEGRVQERATATPGLGAMERIGDLSRGRGDLGARTGFGRRGAIDRRAARNPDGAGRAEPGAGPADRRRPRAARPAGHDRPQLSRNRQDLLPHLPGPAGRRRWPGLACRDAGGWQVRAAVGRRRARASTPAATAPPPRRRRQRSARRSTR